jgi:hypothetical protein
MRNARAAALAALVALAATAACTGGAKTYARDGLPKLVLQPSDAPEGTTYDAQDSGPQDLDQFAGTDKAKRAAFAAAGFEGAYFAQFVSPGLSGGAAEQTPQIAVSFALLFPDVARARLGLQALEADVRRRGTGLSDRPDPKLGDGSFALYGTFRRGVPPGFMHAWRLNNGVFGVIASGVNVDERAVAVLAQKMIARER